MKHAFGPYIRKTRTLRDLNQSELAKACGVSSGYLSQMERGLMSLPGEETIKSMAEVLEQNPDELLAMCGKVSSDLIEIILQDPVETAAMLRRLSFSSKKRKKQTIPVENQETLEFFPLESISLETHTAIIGPSNSGKSILIRHLIHTYFKNADIKVYDSDARPNDWKDLTVKGRKADYEETALEMAKDLKELQHRTELYGDGFDPGNEIVRVVEEWPTTAASLSEIILKDVPKDIGTTWLKSMLRRGRKYRMKAFCVAQEFEVNAWKIGGEGGLRNAFTVLYLGKSARTALRKVSDKDLKAQLKKHFDSVQYPCLADVQGQFYPVLIPDLSGASSKKKKKS